MLNPSVFVQTVPRRLSPVKAACRSALQKRVECARWVTAAGLSEGIPALIRGGEHPQWPGRWPGDDFSDFRGGPR
jgi:hypothetical protein